jgi:amino acid transporter
MAASKGHTKFLELSSQASFTPEGTTPVDIPLHINQLHEVWLNAPQIFGVPLILNLPAFLSVVAITVLVYVGVKESRNTTLFMVGFKVVVVLLVILIGAFYVNPENWVPFAPNGVRGVMQGVSAVFFAYVGFDAVSTTAEECKNPQKDLPQGMINSLLICTALYIAISLVLTGMVKYTELNVGDFIVVAFNAVGLHWLGGILALSAVVATTSVMLVFQLAQPRIWMAMSRDGLLPKKFAHIHPKFRTPSFATIVMGFMVAIPALILDAELATDMNSIGTLFAFAAVCAGILMLPKEGTHGKFMVPVINGRYIIPTLVLISGMLLYVYNPAACQEFFSLNHEALSPLQVFVNKIPHFSFVILVVVMAVLCFWKKLSVIPVLGLLSCFYLMTELGILNWQRFGVWMLIGFAIYFLYGYHHSQMGKEEETKS